MRDRLYQQVVAALLHLRCQVGYESDDFITMVRGAVILQVLPKHELVSVEVQVRVLRAFSISEDEYLAAIAATVSVA